MRFLIDENLSPQTTDFLTALGYDTISVRRVMKGADDEAIVEYAIRENRTIVTLDLDFGHIYYFSRRNMVGVIVLRIRFPTIERVNKVLKGFLKNLDVDEYQKCLIILSEDKFRVLR